MKWAGIFTSLSHWLSSTSPPTFVSLWQLTSLTDFLPSFFSPSPVPWRQVEEKKASRQSCLVQSSRLFDWQREKQKTYGSRGVETLNKRSVEELSHKVRLIKCPLFSLSIPFYVLARFLLRKKTFHHVSSTKPQEFWEFVNKSRRSRIVWILQRYWFVYKEMSASFVLKPSPPRLW